ncbi:5'-methylthioadenosine/S-adenosylhomocysteine nucleosidase family protein [Methylomarinum vadi]|uniref:5'-methylthioadenosine/S-adenosylhomocysteine nucleosidase family protein n=1 Tax=Methylomarinum vadi TaxID=438855 RepID=UPI00068D67CF|nr:hypothetical protein [Methylomarinum vadi]
MIDGPNAELFIFAALVCEAKPLIKRYDLRKIQQPHPFAVYANEGMTLVVTGVGKVAMAGAVAYSMALFRPKHPLMINLGIAGHKSMAVGSLLMADKVVDANDSTKTYYPQLIGRFPCQTLPLNTLVTPSLDYVEEFLYDMEGAAFYEMAAKFSSSELIQCLKIISDNQRESAENINAQAVSEWIGQKIDVIDAIIIQLQGLRRQLAEGEPSQYSGLLERYHFSVSSRIKLKALLNRWRVISANKPLEINDDFVNAKQLLKWLEAKIDEQDFYL